MLQITATRGFVIMSEGLSRPFFAHVHPVGRAMQYGLPVMERPIQHSSLRWTCPRCGYSVIDRFVCGECGYTLPPPTPQGAPRPRRYLNGSWLLRDGNTYPRFDRTRRQGPLGGYESYVRRSPPATE